MLMQDNTLMHMPSIVTSLFKDKDSLGVTIEKSLTPFMNNMTELMPHMTG